MTRPAWMDSGMCNPKNAHLFFADKGDRDAVRQARSICASCQVRQQCLDYALTYCTDRNVDHGIWAGTTEQDRRRIRNGTGQHHWICSVPGCDRLPYGQVGICTAHYKRLQDHGDVRAHIPIEPRQKRRWTA